jgi:hypothetical protein
LVSQTLRLDVVLEHHLLDLTSFQILQPHLLAQEQLEISSHTRSAHYTGACLELALKISNPLRLVVLLSLPRFVGKNVNTTEIVSLILLFILPVP